MKNINKKKALVLSMAMAALLLLPVTLTAQAEQQGGGLFGDGTNTSKNEEALLGNSRGQITLNGVSNQNFGETAPLGSGIVIMLLAGAGYVALKKKED